LPEWRLRRRTSPKPVYSERKLISLEAALDRFQFSVLPGKKAAEPAAPPNGRKSANSWSSRSVNERKPRKPFANRRRFA
jgi:hypothetical protein